MDRDRTSAATDAAGGTTRYRRRADVLWRTAPGMLVLATVEGDFLAAGGTAPDVWEALGDERTLAELTAGLAATFAAPPDVVGEHVGPFVRELERAGWVRAVPGPA